MDKLSILLLIPLITAIVILLAHKEKYIKVIALTGSVAQLIYSGWLTGSYILYRNAGIKAAMLFGKTVSWFAPLHIFYRTGVDGISLTMIMLTAMVVVAGILVSWKIKSQVKEFFFLILLLSLGAYGFFISTDLFLMFFFLELAVIPKYLLIGIWGSGKKEYSAMKLALMLMAGSALVFLGIIGLNLFSGTYSTTNTWDLQQLAQIKLPIHIQRVLYIVIFTGFGVFTAMFPFHT